VNWEDDNDVSWQFQDDGRTLKVFVNKVKPKSPVEEAYKEVYGWYPPTTSSVSNYEDNRWSAFQDGYNASQEPKKEQKWGDIVRESVKWCEEHPDESVEDYLTPQGPVGPGPGPKGVIVGYEPTPQTPEQVADGLKEAFREAVKQGVVSSVDKPKDDFMDKMVAKLKGQNLTDLIFDWWEDVFTTNSNDDMETSIDDLVERIKHWLPKEQSAAGSQNAYVECSVEGFNDCLNKIKRKLR
jgi:hypothetical protein